MDQEKIAVKSRAWAEIDVGNLLFNVRAISALLHKKTAFMAVVKANAYGHGDLKIAHALNRAGIRHFAGATLDEGIRLRKHGIKGEILILGYTDPQNAKQLRRYRLTATAVDLSHAKELNLQKADIAVHVKLDTGMHRLGVDWNAGNELAEIYRMKHLRITGLYSHCSAADQTGGEAVRQTETQLRRFSEAVKKLKAEGISPGRLHVQSSYAAVRYPEPAFDLVRVGILMYGADSGGAENMAEKLSLRPVLSLKSRVVSIRNVEKGSLIGYGTGCRAGEDKSIAAVSVGYADGIPRNYTGSGAAVILRGRLAPVAGRICMDQLLIDVTAIRDATPGDTVTIIGRDGGAVIRAETVAKRCGTITNELFARLGSRIKRIYIDESGI